MAAQAELLDALLDVFDLLLGGAVLHDDDHGHPLSGLPIAATRSQPHVSCREENRRAVTIHNRRPLS